MRPESTIFRNEALESLSQGNDNRHDALLEITPGWTTWTYWLLVGLVIAASLYAVIGTIDEYATGVGVIRDQGRTLVTATTGGTIRRIAVQPGQQIQIRQPRVYFDDSQAAPANHRNIRAAAGSGSAGPAESGRASCRDAGWV